ncbi:Non-specific lipid-transfer protein [Euphorbia peplus]|nr:Non-specific lipid-transfer protein [Euphorbia peplus]
MAISRIINLVFLTAVVAGVAAEAAITCSDVERNVIPCINYVQYGGQVSSQCCGGIRALNDGAKSPADRQAVCKCLTSAVKGLPYTAFNLRMAAGLPAKCNVNLPYKIDPNTSCDKIRY